MERASQSPGHGRLPECLRRLSRALSERPLGKKAMGVRIPGLVAALLRPGLTPAGVGPRGMCRLAPAARFGEAPSPPRNACRPGSLRTPCDARKRQLRVPHSKCAGHVRALFGLRSRSEERTQLPLSAGRLAHSYHKTIEGSTRPDTRSPGSPGSTGTPRDAWRRLEEQPPRLPPWRFTDTARAMK